MRASTRVRRPCTARTSARGFSLVELCVSAAVFVLVAGAVCNAIVASAALNRTNRETVLAMQAAGSLLEELKATPLEETFARYNASKADDPGTGASPGPSFAVEGLNVVSDDPDGFAGEIEFPGDGTELREDDDDLELGLPRDLSGDTQVDKNDHSGDYRLLPVRVTVRWTGKTGERSVDLVTVLNDP